MFENSLFSSRKYPYCPTEGIGFPGGRGLCKVIKFKL